MAEFVQTMKDWRRMCMAMERLRPDDPCAGCRLEGYGCPAIYEDNSHVDYSDVARNVTAWAAEHPEPVYPTWWSWLIDQGVIEKGSTYTGAFDQLKTKSISAELAEKLEIEPKPQV